MACQDAEIHAPVAEGDRHEEERCCQWHCSIVLLEKYGQKVMQERKKTYRACKKMKKGEALTSLQIEAMAIVNENSKLQISDLPAEYQKAIEKLKHYEVGVCSRCRFQSGCLSCSIEKCTAYWMRREGKRLGRSICAEYML